MALTLLLQSIVIDNCIYGIAAGTQAAIYFWCCSGISSGISV